MVRDGRAYKYAQWAVSETEGMVPHYVKVQAQQWILLMTIMRMLM